MKRFAVLLALAVLLTLLACGNNDDNNTIPPPPLQPGNNSATLIGEQIGSGQSGVEPLRQPIEVTVLSPHPALSLGQGYKARANVDTSVVQWLVEVTNTGEEALAGISAGSIVYLDTAGEVMEYTGPTSTNLFGNVGITTLGSDTSCLAPGESGWLLGQLTLDYDTLATLQLGYLADLGETPTAPQARMIPQSYNVLDTGWWNLEIMVKNTGSWVARLGSFSSVCMLIDVDGTPLFWGELDYMTDDAGTTEAGQSRVMYGHMPYTSAAGTMQVIVGFYDLSEDYRFLPTQ
ncbi:MAG: hypothetical protein K8R90_09885 [Candidatus Cloacimonetes bacterium]|nr:hypothetical protein [Candidatus Cloacimonadota bacterium]